MAVASAGVGPNVAVRVTGEALRQVRRGHPWIFASSVTSVSRDGAPGDLAVVFDDRRRFAAVGLYDPASPIRVKVLHHGQPATVDEAWWRERLAAAVARRAPLLRSGTTTACRLVHGESDGFPSLVVDRYADTAVVKVYSPAWFPHLETLVLLLVELLAPERVVLRLARSVAPDPARGWTDGATLLGAPPAGPVAYRENGLAFEADVVHGQKTGAFLDQRDNRRLVRSLASGRSVLDVFACTGGFSVHAAAGGAVAVHSVDLSRRALDTARANMARNRDVRPVRACTHTVAAGDAFEELAALAAAGRRFDLVVVDPPSFAANQRSVPGALRAYGRLTRLALGVLAPDGLLFQASCSSRVPEEAFLDAVHGAARRAGVQLDEVARTGHPADHPIAFPEAAYLKAVVARVATPPRRRARGAG